MVVCPTTTRTQGHQTLNWSDKLNWQLQIANRIGRIQLAEVVVRMGNLRTIPPTETGPSNAPDIDESIITVPNAENSTVNFDWKIISVSHPVA